MGRNYSQMETDNEQILNNFSQSLEDHDENTFQKIFENTFHQNIQTGSIIQHQDIQSGSIIHQNVQSGSFIQPFHLCSIKTCKSYFLSEEHLLYHMKEHHKLICKSCQTTFLSKKDYSHHMCSKLKFQCNICLKTFTEFRNLKRHKNHVHKIENILKKRKDEYENDCDDKLIYCLLNLILKKYIK